jgi:hypothetical protein
VWSRLLVLALLPALLGACGGESAPAPPAKPAAADAGERTLTITVVSVVTKSRSQRRSPTAWTAGDRIQFEDDLLNAEARFGRAANAKVGTDAGTMTFTSPSTATMKGVATLPDGTIVFDGTVTRLANGTVSIPVTGGTGAYENATGTVVARTGTKRSRNVYRLVLGGEPAPVA